MMAHGQCRHPKFEVVLSLIIGRRFSRHQSPHILSCIIHGVALYAGIKDVNILSEFKCARET